MAQPSHLIPIWYRTWAGLRQLRIQRLTYFCENRMDWGVKIKLCIKSFHVWGSQPQKTSKRSSGKFRNDFIDRRTVWLFDLAERLRICPSQPIRGKLQRKLQPLSVSYVLPVVTICWEWSEIGSTTTLKVRSTLPSPRSCESLEFPFLLCPCEFLLRDCISW